MTSEAAASQAPSPGQPGAESQPTDAQQAEAERAGNQNVTGTPQPSDAQQEQYQKDQQARIADPNAVVAREANPEFGGESFAYGDRAPSE